MSRVVNQKRKKLFSDSEASTYWRYRNVLMTMMGEGIGESEMKELSTRMNNLKLNHAKTQKVIITVNKNLD